MHTASIEVRHMIIDVILYRLAVVLCPSPHYASAMSMECLTQIKPYSFLSRRLR